jgi:hypothetical protein
VRNFAVFLRRSPDAATSEDVRLYQLHMAKQQIGAPTINAAVAALRFFFNMTIERPELGRPLTGLHKPRRAPVVLSEEKVVRLLEAAPHDLACRTGQRPAGSLCHALAATARMVARMVAGGATPGPGCFAVNTIRDVMSPLERLSVNRECPKFCVWSGLTFTP